MASPVDQICAAVGSRSRGPAPLPTVAVLERNRAPTPLRVLVCAPGDDLRGLLCSELRALGCEVEPDPFGRAAMGRSPGERPDLILLQRDDPRLDPWPLVRTLRGAAWSRQPPILLCWAAGGRTAVPTAEPAAWIVGKPFDAGTFAKHLPRAEGTRAAVIGADPALRRLCRICLELAGWRVDELANDPQAVTRLTEDPPALVVLDLLMPRFDGFALHKLLAERGGLQGAGLIVLTPRDLDAEDLARLHPLGGRGAAVLPLLHKVVESAWHDRRERPACAADSRPILRG